MSSISIPVTDTTIFTNYTSTETEVVLGNGWTDISGYAFNNSNVTNVIIPNSLTRIGDYAFADSNTLTSINILYDSSLTTIGKSAFNGTSITEIFIPSGVTTIGDAAFESSDLTNVYMSTNTLSNLNLNLDSGTDLSFNTTNNFYGKSGVTILNVETVTTFVKNRNNVRIPIFIDISGALFESSYTNNSISKSNILEVVIGTNVTSIGNEAFSNAINLDKVKLGGYNNKGQTLTSIGVRAFNGTSITDITIPLSVQTIGSEAFKDNQNLTTVTIEDSTQITSQMSIGASAFMNTTLTTINIPTRVTTIETNTFTNTKLTNVYIPYKVTTIGSNAFSNITNLTVSIFDVNMTILNSTELSPNITIGINENFYGAINATVTTPSSTLSIKEVNGVDEYTIYTNTGNTVSLTNNSIGESHTVNLGTGITTISSNFLTSNSKVTTLIMSNYVTDINDNAFKDVITLTQIYIPLSVRSIGDSAFNGMQKLSEIHVDSSNDIFVSVDGVLYNKNKTKIIRYPPGKSDTDYDILDSVVTIGSYSFENLQSSVNLTIPQTVTSINANAFDDANISTIVFDVSTTVDTLGISIGDNVSFYDISTNVSFTTKVFNGIGTLTNATQDMSGGIYVDIYGYSSIGEDAFLDADIINDVEMSISVTDICNNAFKGATALNSVSIPSSVTSIGNDVFSNTSVTSIYIPASVTNMNANTFRGSSLTTTYMLAETATRLNIALSTSQTLYGKEAVTVSRIDATNDLIIKRIYTNLEFVTFMRTRVSSTFVTTNITHTLPTVNSNNKYISNRVQITMPDYDLGSMSIYNKKLLVDLVKTTYAREIDKHVDNIKVTLSSGSVNINIDILKEGVTESMVPICFPAGTLVTTDQGSISIEELETDIHTIRGKQIVAITQTTPIFKHIICIQKDALGMNIPNRDVCISNEHKVFYKGKMVKAKDLIGLCNNVTKVPYNGEILYNVLLEKHDKMLIHNLICETLDPENIMAKICKGKHSTATNNKIFMELNKIIKTNDVVAYKNVCDYLSKQL